MKAGFSASFWLVYVISMVLIGLLTQAVTCLLGWLLHFILAGFRHKAIVATVFMTAVMVLYFVGIGQIENLMMLLVSNGGKIASAVQSFAWPFYALGAACFGDWLKFALFALICIGVFAAVTVVLNVTFVRAMLVGGKTKRAAKQKRDGKVRTAMGAVCRKECKRFFSSTTYLVNIGMGLFMIVAFVGAGIIMKEKLSVAMALIPGIDFEKLLPILLTGAMGLLASMAPISAPSVSLEGKNIWILRSMPISGADILQAKLRFHCIASVPVAAIGALVLGIVYEVGWFETIFMVIGTVLLFVLTGVLGLVFNMCFPRLDWANEAGPVKQSMAVFFSMFGMMFISAGYVGLYFGFTALLGGAKNSLLAFSMVNVLFIFVIYFFYLLMVKWGGKKFETL
jgi:ABC-2 type transport system permease protein